MPWLLKRRDITRQAHLLAVCLLILIVLSTIVTLLPVIAGRLDLAAEVVVISGLIGLLALYTLNRYSSSKVASFGFLALLLTGSLVWVFTRGGLVTILLSPLVLVVVISFAAIFLSPQWVGAIAVGAWLLTLVDYFVLHPGLIESKHVPFTIGLSALVLLGSGAAAALASQVAAASLREQQQLYQEARQALVDLQRTETERAQLLQRLFTAHEESRRHVAQDLHDSVLQDIHLLLKLLELEGRHLDRQDAGAVQHVHAQLMEATRHCIDAMRRVIADLRPTILDAYGLRGAVEEILKGLEPVGVTPVLVGDFPPLSPQLEVAVFRLVQEAVSNVRNHAAAQHLWIVVAPREGLLLGLEIRDDGCGFHPDQARAKAAMGHIGLVGMAENAAAFGGSLTVQSTPGQGTVLQVAFPLQPAKALAAHAAVPTSEEEKDGYPRSAGG